MKKVLFFSLLTVLCLSTNAAGKKKSNKKQKAPVEKVDTVDSATFAYLIGRLNTQGLKQYLVNQKGVDTTYMAQFIDGFQQDNLSEADKIAKARIGGTEIRQDVEKRVIKSINKQINDSVDMLNQAQFIQGFLDALQDKPCTFTTDSAAKIVQTQMEYYRKENMMRKYGKNITEGEAFLKANAKKDSVVTLPDGLQYKILVAGTGEKPTKDQKVKVNYEGRLINGTVFDSSYKRKSPATFGVSQVIPGWTEALQLMPVGSKWEIYIPQNLAYGDREQQKIPPYSTLIFTVELVEIVK